MEDDTGGGDRFHRNEAISAVQDEDPYLGEEDYEDFDDLYNDVNVGEGFRQSVPRLEDQGFSGAEEKKSLPQQHVPSSSPQRQQQQQQLPPQLPPLPPGPAPMIAENVNIPGIAGEVKSEGGGGGAGFPNMGYSSSNEQVNIRAPAIANAGSVRPDLGQFGGKAGEARGQYGNPNFGNEGYARQGGGGGSGNVAGSSAGGNPNFGNEGYARQGGGGRGSVAGSSTGAGGPVNYNTNGNVSTAGGGGSGGGGTILFVGDLHWWTTDADLEGELYKYGQVKEVKFFDEKASGKSKGYCQVEFYDPMAAAACKEGMNGHVFNGRPCVVAFASPYSIRRMGEAQMSKNQSMASQSASGQGGRGRGGSGISNSTNYGGGRGGSNWGRGGAAGGRGQMGNIRNRMGPSGGRGIMGNGGMINPPPPPVLNPGNMFGQGFDPSGYGAMMGRMGGGYGGFPGGPAAPPFTGVMPSFPTMVAPHVNPAFFGRGMAPGGAGMWSDPNAGGWGAEEQSSYGEDAASDHQYGEGSHGKDRMSDRDWSGAPERKHRDDREMDVGPGHELPGRRHHDDREVGRDRERERERDRDREKDRERERERDRYRDDRERHSDHYRHRERESYRDGDWDRGRSSRARSKSREFEYSKRRRATPD